MKNYEEKEKKLENVLKKLNTMSNEVVKMNNDINSLTIEKNQLIGEKQESEKNFQILVKVCFRLYFPNFFLVRHILNLNDWLIFLNSLLAHRHRTTSNLCY